MNFFLDKHHKKVQNEKKKIKHFQNGRKYSCFIEIFIKYLEHFLEFPLKIPFKAKKYFPFNFLYNIALIEVQIFEPYN